MNKMKVIRKNLDDMLKDRTYKFIEEKDGYLLYESNKGKKHTVIVYFTFSKVGVEFVKKTLAKTEDMEIYHIILVSQEKLTPFANKHIVSVPTKMEIFLIKELKFNITKHYLVPQHVLLSQTDSQKIIDYYGKKNLPQIRQVDILSRYFDANIGQVFRIYRNEGGIHYRMVVT